MTVAPNDLTLHGLVCHRDLEMALLCLGSILKYSDQPLKLIIHDDGSLTKEDQQLLLEALKGSKIITRAEADEQMQEHLKNHHHCQRYRSEHIYGLKLLDIALLSPGDFAYCDSDILFFRPFQNLFAWPNQETSAIFMQDYVDAYSMLPWELIGSGKPKLVSKVNAGLSMIRKSAYDIDFIDWFLGQESFRHKVGWLEQSCWAALGHRIGCRQWNPQQIVLMRSWTQLTEQMVAGHFVKEVRYRLPEFKAAADALAATDASIFVETFAPDDCGLLALAQVHALRQLKRARNYNRIFELLQQKFAGVGGNTSS
jgi:hypothetical protein